jgi:protein phosphatase
MKFQLNQPQAINELGARSNQEDFIFPLAGEASAEQRVFVVCDGMGGLDKGEVASETVSKALGQMADAILSVVPVFSDDDFRHCLSNAYDALDAADAKNEASMGTTMAFLCFHKGGCLVAHIGDSRIYHLRPSLGPEKGVLYRSRDHSLVQQLYEQGEISYEEMRTSPRKNIILKAMQPHLEQRVEATLVHITDVKPGDYFYLCTDGMLEQMEDSELMSILGSTDSDEQKRQQLINATASNADNHSAYLIRVKDVKDVDKEPDNKPVASETKKSQNPKMSFVTTGLSFLALLAGIAAGIAVF